MNTANNDFLVVPQNPPVLSAQACRLLDLFEHLTPERVSLISRFYAADAFFKDPFNEVNRVEDIEHIFGKMFHQVNNPRFVIHTAFESEQQLFIAWDFLFEMKRFRAGEVQRVKGSSHLQWNENGLVQYHRDYWDAAEELYEKIPVLGGLMRWLKKRAG